jgi:hypothetical protein
MLQLQLLLVIDMLLGSEHFIGFLLLTGIEPYCSYALRNPSVYR